MLDESIRDLCKRKRIAAFDYGKKRIGWAVCDELHIVTSTKGVFAADDKELWTHITEALLKERIGACIVGIPQRTDDQPSAMVEACTLFARTLREKSSLPVFTVDESFSSKRAVETMVEIGVRKSQRREKSRTDEISAAIILRDFLRELS